MSNKIMLPKLKINPHPISTRNTSSLVNLSQNPTKYTSNTNESKQLKATQS